MAFLNVSLSHSCYSLGMYFLPVSRKPSPRSRSDVHASAPVGGRRASADRKCRPHTETSLGGDFLRLAFRCLSLRRIQGASVALFIIAIITATARTAIRLKQQRRLYVDDVFLFIAVIFLVASMGLLWHQLDEMYTAEALVTNSASFVALTGNWIDQLFWFLKISDAFLVLSWTSVLAVKFSFLFFFRNLIDRVRGMKTYWWIVMAITLAVWAFGCGAVFAPCPYFDLRSRTPLKLHADATVVNIHDVQSRALRARSMASLSLIRRPSSLLISSPTYSSSSSRSTSSPRFKSSFDKSSPSAVRCVSRSSSLSSPLPASRGSGPPPRRTRSTLPGSCSGRHPKRASRSPWSR